MSDFGIEPMTAEEFRKAQIPKATRTVATEPRTRVVWFTLPTSMGFCTIEAHEEVQKILSQDPEKKTYRDTYPVRHVYEISEGVFICRDCFIAGVDKDGSVRDE